MFLKSSKDVQTHHTNQAIIRSIQILKQNKYQLSFEQIREVRDLLDSAVLASYGGRKYDGTNGNGYQPLPSFNDNPTPPKRR